MRSRRRFGVEARNGLLDRRGLMRPGSAGSRDVAGLRGAAGVVEDRRLRRLLGSGMCRWMYHERELMDLWHGPVMRIRSVLGRWSSASGEGTRGAQMFARSALQACEPGTRNQILSFNISILSFVVQSCNGRVTR